MLARQSSHVTKRSLPSLPVHPLTNLKPIFFGPDICRDLEQAASKEWVITNGIGGYASSTIVGMNTRRSHGLLVAATHPPVGRVVLLSSLEETIVAPQGRFELATHRYAAVVHPEGYRYLVEFRLDPCPTFLYRMGSLLLEKKIVLLPGENAVVIGYTLYAATGPVELAIRPLVAVRDFRWVSQENPQFNSSIHERPGEILLHPYEELPAVVIQHTAELFDRSPCWYKNFDYLQEKERPAPGREDLWSPGRFLYLLKVGESCAVVVSTGRRGGTDLAFHERRLENTQTVAARSITPPGQGPLTTRLSWTAESFLAHRPGETVLLAGFPHLSPWGRDTLIALPGLTLATKRFDLARALLETLASKVKSGLLPVRYAEDNGSPEYDSADTSLWFFWAVWHYWKATRETAFIRKKLVGPMREIMEGYLEGTDFGIGMDEDGLIQLSDEEMPLTWMDAREPGSREDLPGPAVTPRSGRPVEINALWYCALSVMGVLGGQLGLKRADAYLRLSQLVQENFLRTFLAPDGCLYDRVTARTQDASFRPNMLIAASLPFTPLSRTQAAHILAVVEERLLTPYGLRTLSADDSRYQRHYAGDLKQKARAAHQGTVWPWLLGPYVSTVIAVRRRTRATQADLKKQLEPFYGHLHEAGVGAVSEIFDGDPPHTPRGGISQAWSVGEILRAIQEAKLSDL